MSSSRVVELQLLTYCPEEWPIYEMPPVVQKTGRSATVACRPGQWLIRTTAACRPAEWSINNCCLSSSRVADLATAACSPAEWPIYNCCLSSSRVVDLQLLLIVQQSGRSTATGCRTAEWPIYISCLSSSKVVDVQLPPDMSVQQSGRSTTLLLACTDNSIAQHVPLLTNSAMQTWTTLHPNDTWSWIVYNCASGDIISDSSEKIYPDPKVSTVYVIVWASVHNCPWGHC